MNLFFKKKQIKGYPKSFAKRLTWRIMLRMIISQHQHRPYHRGEYPEPR